MSNPVSNAAPAKPSSVDVDNRTLFEALLNAESESQVDSILQKISCFNDDPQIWKPFGGFNNNFSTVGNQHAEAAGALVEKIVNSLDAVLMAECYKRGIDPKGKTAPQSMSEAIETFFDVKDGRIGALDSGRQTKLADNIHLIATGEAKASESEPCYLIVDRGEGQTPSSFPATFLGLREENKVMIHFVQGKFHSGGTGVLQFCGTRNYQLIVSRRHPDCPVDNPSEKDLWGFTLVRRIRPTEERRSSRYVYYAPNGNVPSFRATSVNVLPFSPASKQKPNPYAAPLEYGTCIKLYNFRWKGNGPATTQGRYELEKFFHAPCLPFRATETRPGYKANYFSTTISGVWANIESEDDNVETSKSKVEAGFPAYEELNLENVGRLPYRIVVFKEHLNPRHLPSGICYTVNGQVHGTAPADFITRKLEFSYLKDHLLVSVECEHMDPAVREDWILNSRDRVRRNETDKLITAALADALKKHPGLRELNALRRQKEVETALANDKEGIDFLQQLVSKDPMLANLFSLGTHLVTSSGPGGAPKLFVGQKFPSYFRLANEPKGGLVKACPINCTASIEFETDAENDYFKRGNCPGEISISPLELCEHSRLWNGRFSARFRAPWNAKVGDLIPISITVSDVERESGKGPFVCRFTLQITEEEERAPGARASTSGFRETKIPRTNGNSTTPALAKPNIRPIRKEEWQRQNPPFTPYTALRIKNDGKGGYDFFLNIDNTYLLTELTRTPESDKELRKFWFRWGLALAAIGMLREQKRREKNGAENSSDLDAGEEDQNIEDFEVIGKACDGLAAVIIPIIRQLYRGEES